PAENPLPTLRKNTAHKADANLLKHTIDMYAADRTDLVFDFAKAEDDPEALMDQFNPEWRERYRTDFTPVKMSDGNWSLQMKD
ncbi:hypothetical protein PMQ18_07860, partial [Bifidobacterium longum]|nr:hypothetical protein [Bifidobacterium longum]